MLMNLAGLRSEKGCAGDSGKNRKLQTRLLVREVVPHQLNHQIRNCQKIIKEIKRNIGLVSQMGARHQYRLAD
jgi:hypothetical protein